MKIIPKTGVLSCLIGQKVWMNIGRTEFILLLSLELLTIIIVLTADGEKRTFHSPKKKNINHLTLYDCVSPEVQNSINETGRVTNGKLRFSLLKFVRKQVTDLKKGEHLNGERRCN